MSPLSIDPCVFFFSFLLFFFLPKIMMFGDFRWGLDQSLQPGACSTASNSVLLDIILGWHFTILPRNSVVLSLPLSTILFYKLLKFTCRCGPLAALNLLGTTVTQRVFFKSLSPGPIYRWYFVGQPGPHGFFTFQSSNWHPDRVPFFPSEFPCSRQRPIANFLQFLKAHGFHTPLVFWLNNSIFA